MGQAPRYRTLRDYLAVMRSQRLVIVATIVIFGAVALGLTVPQDKVYEAEAALEFTGIASELEAFGESVVPRFSPTDASTNAEFVQSDDVAELAARKLRTRNSPERLLAAIESQAETSTGFIVIKAEAGDPVFAARIANTFAQAAREVRTKSERRRLRRAASTLQRRFDRRSKGLIDRVTAAAYADRVARIDSLAEVATPVEITRTAEAPEGAASPQIFRTTLLGLLLGLVVGLLIAFVRDILDVRLRAPGDVRRAVDLPLLGTVRREALGKLPPVLQEASPERDIDLDSFRIIRTNLDFLAPDERVRSIAVTSGVAGEGKTTVAMSLAAAAAASGRSAILLECDLRRPEVASRLGVPQAPGLLDLLAGRATPQDAIRNVLPVAGATNGSATSGRFDAVPVGETAGASVEVLGSAALRDFLGVISRSYDLVVLDTAPLLPVADTLQVLPMVDAIAFCVRASQTTRDQVKAAHEVIGRFPPRPTGLIVTGISDEGDIYSGGYAAYEGSGVS